MKKPIKLIAVCFLVLSAFNVVAQDKAKQIEQLLNQYNQYGLLTALPLSQKTGKLFCKKDTVLPIWNGIFQISRIQNSD